MQITYAAQQLHYQVSGMHRKKHSQMTPAGHGAGAARRPGLPCRRAGGHREAPEAGLSQSHGCATENVLTPRASFPGAEHRAAAGLRRHRGAALGLPRPVRAGRLLDAVNPVTGAVGQRDLVLDQSMIMASLDNALNNRAIQRDFARDPVSWAAHTYLPMETMSMAG